jgi:REP element-mobilizing transposase RayT
LSRAAGFRLPLKDATGEKIFMENVNSIGPKKIMHDTRNNWITMMFPTHKRYRNFRKQSHIDTCTQAFRDLERFGFEFGEFGFAENHVHFQVNIPKRYSIQNAEILLKSYSSRKMFEVHPGFRKRYPRGGFWSGYEHYESTGLTNLEESSVYLRDQQRHHKVTIINDRQQHLTAE